MVIIKTCISLNPLCVVTVIDDSYVQHKMILDVNVI